MNEKIEEWPKWVKKEDDVSSNTTNESVPAESLEGLEYKHSDTVPKPRLFSRCSHRYYDYYVDNEKNLTYFYSKNGYYNNGYRKLTKQPEQKDVQNIIGKVVLVVSNEIVPPMLLKNQQ